MKLLEIAFWAAGVTQVTFYAASQAWEAFERHRSPVTSAAVVFEAAREVDRQVAHELVFDVEEGLADPCVRQGAEFCQEERDDLRGMTPTQWIAHEQVSIREMR